MYLSPVLFCRKICKIRGPLLCLSCYNLLSCNICPDFFSQYSHTGKSLSEALIFASINPKFDNRLFMELPWEHVLPMFYACSFHGNSVNNLLSYCGVVDARISASEKDLPVSLLLLSKCLRNNVFVGQYRIEVL